MRDITVLLAETEYEVAHGRSPRGIGGWAFEFDRAYFNVERLLDAARAHNASTMDRPRCLVDLTTRPGRVLVWMHGTTYLDAKRAMTLLVKLSARTSPVVGKVAP